MTNEIKTIWLPQTLDAFSLLPLLQDIDLNIHKNISIDFATLHFVYPDGIGVLAAIIDKWVNSDVKVFLLNAPTCDPFQYLQRMDFFKHFSVFGDESFNRHSQGGRFAPIEQINSCNNDVQKISNNLVNIIIPDGQNELSRSELSLCLAESINNIQDHARLGSRNGYTLGQVYHKQGDIEYFIVAVDTGIGIKESLRRGNGDIRDKITDDQNALEWACKPGITGGLGLKDDFGNPRNQGQGLAVIDKITETTGGSFYLLSGNAIRYRNGYSVINNIENNSWQGTIVIVKLYKSGISRYYESAAKPRTSLRFK